MRKFSPFLLLLSEQRYTRILVAQFVYPNLVFCFVFVVVHNFFYPHFPIRIRHPQVSSPRFADTSFASRFFEPFTLPASVTLNTERRSAPSMRAFKEEERSVLISVTLMKGITGYKITVSQLLGRKSSFLYCLFVLPAFLVFFFFLLFLFSAFFFHRHFTIRIFHPYPPSAGIRSAFYRHPLKSTTSNRFNFRIINSLMNSWGYA